jgi:hypothetical protein
MGRDRHKKERRGGDRLPQFVPLFIKTLDSPAWRALSHGGRSLYTALKRRVSPGNNGRLFISQRGAKQEIGSHHNEIARWFRELQHYGFIVQTQGGSLGIDGRGKAPHWRLTELPHLGEPPTRDFERWDGRKFVDQKTKPRAGNGARGVLEMAHTSVLETRPPSGESVLEMAHIQGAEGVPEKAHITSIPLPSPSLPDPSERLAKRAPQGAVASELPAHVPISAELGSSALVIGKPIMWRPSRQRVTR